MTTSNPNVKFCYQYRDGANYKNYNEVVFLNDTGKTIAEIKDIIKKALINGEWFIAENWKLPDLHFIEYKWDLEIDHDWHEFISIDCIDELQTSSFLLSAFLKSIVQDF